MVEALCFQVYVDVNAEFNEMAGTWLFVIEHNLKRDRFELFYNNVNLLKSLFEYLATGKY